jgi:PAS domain S-box-containing protein
MHAPQQPSLYRLLVENSLGLMCVHDLDGQLLTINPAAAESLGYRVEDSIGRNIRDFIAPSVRHLFDEYLERIRTNTVDRGAMRLLTKDGTERIWLYRNVRYEESGSPTLVLGHAVDITERIMAERALRQTQEDLARARDELELRVAERTAELQETNERLRSEMERRYRIEEELLRTRKLDAIGRLAGGIAHDFNNLMTIIVGYCESLRPATASSPILQKQVSEIYKAAQQANSLTRQLLAFSRRQRLESHFVNLNDVLTDMSDMLHRLLSDDIEVTMRTDPEL